mgnify:CR=1 FL=1
MYRSLILTLATVLATASATSQQALDVRSIPAPRKQLERTIVDPTGVVPGPAGVGVIWDFRSLSPGVAQLQEYLSIDDLPQAVRDSFPTTQVAIQTDTTTSLYTTVGRYFRLIGTITPNTQLTVTTDPYDTRPTEIVYSGRLIDAHKAIIRVRGGSGPVIRRNGQHSVVYDGYGTLQLPTATYANVARLTAIGTTTDSLAVNAVTTVTRRTFRRTTYQMFDSDIVLMEIQEVITNVTRNGQPVGQQTTTRSVVHYGRNVTTDVQEEPESKLVTSPNPTSGSQLMISGLLGDIRSLQIFTMAGNAINGATWTLRSDEEVAITLPDLSSGTYVLTVEMSNGTVRVLPFTVVR